MVHGRDKVPLLGRTAAAGTRTDAAVIRVGEVSSGEVQQEMRRWHRAYGERKAVPLLCPLGRLWETTNKSCAQCRQSYKFGLVWTKPPVILLLIVFTGGSVVSVRLCVSTHTALTSVSKDLYVFHKRRVVICRHCSLFKQTIYLLKLKNSVLHLIQPSRQNKMLAVNVSTNH